MQIKQSMIGKQILAQELLARGFHVGLGHNTEDRWYPVKEYLVQRISGTCVELRAVAETINHWYKLDEINVLEVL